MIISPFKILNHSKSLSSDKTSALPGYKELEIHSIKEPSFAQHNSFSFFFSNGETKLVEKNLTYYTLFSLSPHFLPEYPLQALFKH